MSSSQFTGFYRSGQGATQEITEGGALRSGLADEAGLVWIDLFTRTPEEASILDEVFRFHPLTIEDCVSERVDPAKVDDYGAYLFLVVQALSEYNASSELEPVEVGLYLGPNYVVSAHRERIRAIELFRERCRQDERQLKYSADRLLHGIIDAIVDEYLPVVDAVDETVDRLEEQILVRPDGQLMQQIMLAKRNALRIRRAAVPQRDVVNRLARGEFQRLVRPDTAVYYRDVYDHLVRIEYLIESLRDIADSALNTYLSAVSNRLNQIVKVLTAAATIFLPLTLISGVYGMNFRENQFPGFDESWGFLAVVGFMVLLAAGMLAFFKYRDWI